ncbi:LOW QUALITY PROTEIN: F-box/WD repeat-containing protein pof10-like [Phoenix dactylifera]|uniref:F-box protein n=1 Tax=Phoenix dactylifera TaxID=42345 RepID=A0A8B8ZW56_PHODC|nr:LOW QUALITY PROTEIN: F-box/WD repeat-containing protein pof10-like [Phoenix dactylifera]
MQEATNEDKKKRGGRKRGRTGSSSGSDSRILSVFELRQQFSWNPEVMERLPGELCVKIFHLFDHQTLATALQVCRKWRKLGSDNALWSSLFKERWGEDSASFYAPQDSKTWKDVYIAQDRCDRYGLGLKIIREGVDYYLIHQGEIQRYLGSCRHKTSWDSGPLLQDKLEQQRLEISDKMLFFIGDLEAACADARHVRM